MSAVKRILCIDDSSTALLLLEYALKGAGFQPLIAANVREAIEIIKTELPDLILLDLSMPDISGYDFLRMKNELKIEKVPIIVVSAYDSHETLTTINELGASDFIAKPIKIDAIVNKIKAILK